MHAGHMRIFEDYMSTYRKAIRYQSPNIYKTINVQTNKNKSIGIHRCSYFYLHSKIPYFHCTKGHNLSYLHLLTAHTAVAVIIIINVAS